MRLWSDEFEAMRPKLRAEADTFIATFPGAPDDPSMSATDRVATLRAQRLSPNARSTKGINRTIAGPGGPIRLRTFVPERVDAVMLHIHGGAFVAGEPEQTDTLHEILSGELDLAFVSVDYRLAPEHPYPAGPDDCEAAAAWLLEHAEAEYGTDRLLIGGESAGAHLSACTLVRVRDRLDAIEHFRGANLVFGDFDIGGTPSQLGAWERPDILSVEMIRFIHECFTPGLTRDERRNPDISPLYADLHDLPPALFTVGADDHFVDDTLLMAHRWALAGNQAELLVYPEAPHGCIGMPTVGAHWWGRLNEFLRACIDG